MGEKGFLKLLYTKLRGKREVYGKDALSTSGGGPPPSYATAVGPPPPLAKKEGKIFFCKRRQAQDFPYFPRQASPLLFKTWLRKKKRRPLFF